MVHNTLTALVSVLTVFTWYNLCSPETQRAKTTPANNNNGKQQSRTRQKPHSSKYHLHHNNNVNNNNQGWKKIMI